MHSVTSRKTPLVLGRSSYDNRPIGTRANEDGSASDDSLSCREGKNSAKKVSQTT